MNDYYTKISCELWISSFGETILGIVLVVFFPKHVNMAQQMKRCVKTGNMFLLSLRNFFVKVHRLAQTI
jgi:hypothetical protein